ncbi:hypothetical protein RBSWK_00014 [Rhodopirellula baltica SWK14]|uniref:Uncharacterized protein n=1 Tax=Rhodopirellula baltica SWK14 TaxID=993516 RepID=L7CQ49_RHOBT|nr:hypothetical protein RBSWK_00014 [Rhodopirellula baltica SWK14]
MALTQQRPNWNLPQLVSRKIARRDLLLKPIQDGNRSSDIALKKSLLCHPVT